MGDREIILSALMDVLGEEGCGVSCEEATIFWDAHGKLLSYSSPQRRRGRREKISL